MSKDRENGSRRIPSQAESDQEPTQEAEGGTEAHLWSSTTADQMNSDVGAACGCGFVAGIDWRERETEIDVGELSHHRWRESRRLQARRRWRACRADAVRSLSCRAPSQPVSRSLVCSVSGARRCSVQCGMQCQRRGSRLLKVESGGESGLRVKKFTVRAFDVLAQPRAKGPRAQSPSPSTAAPHFATLKFPAAQPCRGPFFFASSQLELITAVQRSPFSRHSADQKRKEEKKGWNMIVCTRRVCYLVMCIIADHLRSADKPARGGITSTAERFSCAMPRSQRNGQS